MKHFKNNRHRMPLAFTTCLLGALVASGCMDEASSGITEATGATANEGGESAGAAASTAGTTSGGNPSSSGGDPGEAPTAGKAPVAGSTNGGSAGSAPAAEGGSDGETTQGGAPGAGGAPTSEDEGVQIGRPCAFHTDAPVPAAENGGSGGEGPAPTVLAQQNVFIGSYLTDGAGRTLYTYGADQAGDCQHPPVSGCIDDCLVSWPIFDAGDRVLGPGLDDAAFGSIQRSDGSFQTTYHGWPLYYYKTDLTLGQVAGQGKGKLWHIAELKLPTITIMKSGTLKYLADGYGRTLYVSAADQAGSELEDPISTCKGSCLDTFAPFHEKNFSAVTVLDPLDFEVFVRHGVGGLQLSYKGLPLYLAATDLKSGDMNGTAVEGFTAAVP